MQFDVNSRFDIIFPRRTNRLLAPSSICCKDAYISRFVGEQRLSPCPENKLASVILRFDITPRSNLPPFSSHTFVAANPGYRLSRHHAQQPQFMPGIGATATPEAFGDVGKFFNAYANADIKSHLPMHGKT